jgi:tetratricopeptide (TPR) repeat protein
MKRALAIILGVAMVCLVAYLSWLNPTEVAFRFTPVRTVQAPLATLMVFAFVVGVLIVLIVGLIQAGRRSLTAWRHGRQLRRVERIDQWEEHGEQLVWKGDAPQGRSLLHKAWQRRPESAHAVLALAASYRDTGELPRARQVLLDAAAEHHTNPDILFALAEAHRAGGDRAAAIEVLERLRALYPHAPRVLRALRDLYVLTERWSDAVTAQEPLATHVRDAAPAEHERDYLMVLRYQATLQLPDPAARVKALGALADGRASVPVLVSLGDALIADGRGDEASVVWERALRTTPRTVLLERLVQIATEPRYRDRLRGMLHRLRTDQVQADSVRVLAAQLSLADGNVEDTTTELEALHDAASATPLVHRLWAEAHRRRGHLEQAVSAYARASGAFPGHVCGVCHRRAAEWIALCPQCGHWDSYRSDVEISAL